MQLIYSFGIGMMYDPCRVYRNAARVVERISIGRLQYVSSCRRSAGFAIHTSRALRCIVGKHEEIFKTSRHQNWHFGRCNCVTRVRVGNTRRTLQFVCRRSSINSIRLMIDFFFCDTIHTGLFRAPAAVRWRSVVRHLSPKHPCCAYLWFRFWRRTCPTTVLLQNGSPRLYGTRLLRRQAQPKSVRLQRKILVVSTNALMRTLPAPRSWYLCNDVLRFIGPLAKVTLADRWQ